jgi:lysophospholipase L1-like esterase
MPARDRASCGSMRSLFLLALFAALPCFAAENPQIFTIGDSTMCNYPLDGALRGWAMALGEHFVDPAMVHNHAMSGRSTKSFIDEGRWDKVMAELRAGDFVIIQFAHNDEKKEDPKRYTDPATSFRDNLRKFIRETRAKNATPILATPVSRRKFDASGKLQPTHGAYPDALRAVAKEENVPLLDLEKATFAWLQATGDEPSKKFFMWLAPGEHPKVPEGRKDDTHFREAGAKAVAQLAVDEIRAKKLPLGKWLKKE